MNTDSLYENFIEEMKVLIPQRGKLTNILADLLCIEKEAVYRRLRGEVPFTFSEISKIAIELGISLDAIAESSYPIVKSLISRPLNVRLIEFIKPREEDYKLIEGLNAGLVELTTDPTSESGSISNIIPATLYVSYIHIYKFYLFKWLCQFGDPNQQISYSNLTPTDRLMEINKEFVGYIQSAPSSVYIFDEHFIEYLIKDIQYFSRIRLLKREDIENIKADLLVLLKDMRRYADTGTFDTGKKVSIYVSNVHFDANYNYVDCKNYKLTLIRSFTLSEAYSFDKKIFENVKKWTQFLKRSSTQISESNEIQRIAFFEKQLELVNSL